MRHAALVMGVTVLLYATVVRSLAGALACALLVEALVLLWRHRTLRPREVGEPGKRLRNAPFPAERIEAGIAGERRLRNILIGEGVVGAHHVIWSLSVPGTDIDVDCAVLIGRDLHLIDAKNYAACVEFANDANGDIVALDARGAVLRSYRASRSMAMAVDRFAAILGDRVSIHPYTALVGDRVTIRQGTALHGGVPLVSATALAARLGGIEAVPSPRDVAVLLEGLAA